MLDSLPAYHKKSAALDALSQGIESYWCRNATEDSRVHAYLAILGVMDNLKAYLAGDPHAAEEMLDASYQSGKAIQITRTTAAHAMSYQLTKQLGLAHGHACMVTLPVLWEAMQDREEMQECLSDLCGKMRLSNPQLVPKLLRGSWSFSCLSEVCLKLSRSGSLYSQHSWKRTSALTPSQASALKDRSVA